MKFELSREFISDLSDAIASGNSTVISTSLGEVHPADIAELLEELNIQEIKVVFSLLEDELAADVLSELDDDIREDLLAKLSAKEIAESLENMDSDDAADVVQDLEEHRQAEVISEIEDFAQATDIVSLLKFDENTAGGLMAKEFIKVNENWTVGGAIQEMRRQTKEVEHVYTIYVVNDNNILLGILSLKSILFAEDDAKISTLYRRNVRSVKTGIESEEVVKEPLIKSVIFRRF